MKVKSLIIVALAMLSFASCITPKKITYVQDADSLLNVALASVNIMKVKTGDKLSINVNSKDPTISAMFNLGISRNGNSGGNNGGSNQDLMLYTVDAQGEIEIPVLGKVKVEGLSREEIANLIKQRLMEEELVRDPVVIVSFADMYVSVIGEVKTPGRYDVKQDRVTLVDAISMAGDLTINGLRTNVLVLREENGAPKAYRVDLTQGKDLYASPVYYLQNRDVVYVEPNGYRKRQSTVNGNNMYTPSFWLSIASVLTSLTLVIVTAIRK